MVKYCNLDGYKSLKTRYALVDSGQVLLSSYQLGPISVLVMNVLYIFVVLQTHEYIL